VTRLFAAALDEGRPPRPVLGWPGWEWQAAPGGMLSAWSGTRHVRAHNMTALLERIRKAEGEGHGGGRGGGAA